MIDAYIYLYVGGAGYKVLHLPKNPTQEKRLLRGVKRWIKASDGFDPYDSSMSIRVIDMEGNILYSESTGHAWDVAGRVEDAIWGVRSHTSEEV